MAVEGCRRWLVMADQLTLYQPEGADCALTLLLAHQAFDSFLRHTESNGQVSVHRHATFH